MVPDITGGWLIVFSFVHTGISAPLGWSVSVCSVVLVWDAQARRMFVSAA